VDAIIRLDGDKRKHTSMVVEETRHGPPGSRIDLYLTEADIGDDDEGHPIDVMVVERGDASQEDDVKTAGGPRLSDDQQLIFAHLEDIADDRGQASVDVWFKKNPPSRHEIQH
jgi:hypothetical protein